MYKYDQTILNKDIDKLVKEMSGLKMHLANSEHEIERLQKVLDSREKKVNDYKIELKLCRRERDEVIANRRIVYQ